MSAERELCRCRLPRITLDGRCTVCGGIRLRIVPKVPPVSKPQRPEWEDAA